MNPYETQMCPFCRRERRLCLFVKIDRPVKGIKNKNMCNKCYSMYRNNYIFNTKTRGWKSSKNKKIPVYVKPQKSIKLFSGLTNEQRKKIEYFLSTNNDYTD